MVELLEVPMDEKMDRKHWRIVIQGSWLGTVTYMKDQHLGVRIYEDVVIAPEMLKQIAVAVEEFERKIGMPESLPLFPTNPGEIGN